jgi:putative endonuclease
MGERPHIYFVYMLASQPFGTIYTGVTNDLISRTYDHRSGTIPGFTSKYGVHVLIWFEQHQDINEAILREKRIKKWRRAWKIRLIEKTNPHWEDYYPKLLKAGWFATRPSVAG